jgi:hypothetical protein
VLLAMIFGIMISRVYCFFREIKLLIKIAGLKYKLSKKDVTPMNSSNYSLNLMEHNNEAKN